MKVFMDDIVQMLKLRYSHLKQIEPMNMYKCDESFKHFFVHFDPFQDEESSSKTIDFVNTDKEIEIPCTQVQREVRRKMSELFTLHSLESALDYDPKEISVKIDYLRENKELKAKIAKLEDGKVQKGYDSEKQRELQDRVNNLVEELKKKSKMLEMSTQQAQENENSFKN